QAEDGIRDWAVTGVQTCALPIYFQNLVIGSGVAGKLLGWTLVKQGQRTIVVERSMVGGSCPNVACLPSKNVIYSAKAVSLVHPRSEERRVGKECRSRR